MATNPYRLFGFLLLTVVMLLGLPAVADAAESYDNCTGFITSLPAVISTPGTWCLNQHLSTSIATGNAIEIQANNVTIDCNDFKLDGLAAGLGTQASGIAAIDRVNATVRHCDIRGFLYGVFFKNSYDGIGNPSRTGAHVVEDSRFAFNTFAGIMVQGDGSAVQRNQVLDTGGSTVTPSAQGIIAYYGVDILNNIVSGVVARSGGGGTATGIMTFIDFGGNVRRNRIHGLVKDGGGQVRGIYNLMSGSNSNSFYLTMRDNNLVGGAGTPSFGIACTGNYGGSAVTRDNSINGFATAIFGCGGDGGNVVTP